MSASSATTLQLFTLANFPRVHPGDHLAKLIEQCLQHNAISLQQYDVVCVCSKIVSKAENCFVDLGQIQVSPQAMALAQETQKEPALVELILRESLAISRKRHGVLITRQRLGIISANAGIDRSNAQPPYIVDGGPWALTLPRDPDQSAQSLLDGLTKNLSAAQKPIGVIVTDSLGRPFREGTVGAAIGVAGVPAVWDQRGKPDLDGRRLEFTITAFADQIAAAADLLAGQANEGTPVIIARGLTWPASRGVTSAKQLLRDPQLDLYA